MTGRKPKMFLIAGPNGAGKTTFYKERLAESNPTLPFVNADEIEASINDGRSSYVAARRAALRRSHLIRHHNSFVTGTVFSQPSKAALVEEAHEAGFLVYLYHINVRHPDISVGRVEYRVRNNGHDVPEDKIRAL